MRNLETAMKSAGVHWDQIVRRTIYTTQPTEYEVITRGIHAVTGGADDPPQTIVGITGLAIDGLLIEIECTAMLD
jgi:enamine deaminase RidA (YjgF/YER057c/UK114 family)